MPWSARPSSSTRPATLLTTALFSRFTSQGAGDFGNRVLSAMRKEFGGHDEKPAQ